MGRDDRAHDVLEIHGGIRFADAHDKTPIKQLLAPPDLKELGAIVGFIGIDEFSPSGLLGLTYFVLASSA